ncbi:histidine kinase [Streptomyces sp. NBC_00654]|uniref:sensor histidine kinase n=1 Tax=Streptomyces sp. NBC_00654 TaxID=2975799 RepID=UPI00225517EC|nr:sensor histidine kinase [Streptomyces sp. NBC_00654]MCX4970441.1 histidine kinase [Streptomyces sp. NBC_00654]
MWLRARMRGWQSRSGFDKIDLYTRGTLYSLVWLTAVSQSLLMVTRPVRASDAPVVLIVGTLLTALAQGFCGTRLTARAVDQYLGLSTVGRRLVGLGFVLFLANATGLLALGRYTGVEQFPELQLALIASAVPFATPLVLLVPLWVSLVFQTVVAAALSGGAALAGADGAFVVSVIVSSVFGSGLVAFTTRVSAWSLGVMTKLRDAQDMETRLAVAEERLRFGRDLHDVLGRNLAVIALKSELAVELAQRGHAAAMDQMVEVQRIARTSQQEVRDVVRGYREADLSTELLGARGVLRAAGIVCDIDDRSGGLLAPPVQSALGWVVREAATNVLRHGDPQRCAIRLTTARGAAVLVVENDGMAVAGDGTAVEGDGTAVPGGGAAVEGGGVPDTALGPPGGGSGLAGLRERLAALGGSLEAGPAGAGLFRLTATVPESDAGAGSGSGDGGLASRAAGAGAESGPGSGPGPGPGPGSSPQEPFMEER